MLSLGEREFSAAVVTSVADNSAGLGETAEPSSDVVTGGGIETLLASVGEAEQQPPAQLGAVGLPRELPDSEAQYGLGSLLALASTIRLKRTGS